MKPFFLSTPANQTILADQTAEFACRVGGDPPPEILWRRNDGKMPIGRAHILDDKSLRIERVTSQDQGTYICDAENGVGAISASATLTVHCEQKIYSIPFFPLFHFFSFIFFLFFYLLIHILSFSSETGIQQFSKRRDSQRRIKCFVFLCGSWCAKALDLLDPGRVSRIDVPWK